MRLDEPKPATRRVSVNPLKLTTMKRTKFKTLEQMEREIMKTMNTTYKFAQYEFNPHKKGWRFKFDRAARRLGRADYTTQTISLSKLMCLNNLDNWPGIRDILLHEITHAFCWVIYKWAHDGHGPKFKAIAQALGCEASATVKASASSLNLDFGYRYTYICKTCNTKHQTMRKHKQRRSCAICCPNEFNPKYLIQLESVHY